MKKICLSLTAILLLMNICPAQNVEFKAANFKDKKEEYKAATEGLKKGDEILEIANEAVALVKPTGDNFKKALRHYLKAFELNNDNAELNMKIGNCYLYTNEKYKAKEYITKAFYLDKDLDPMLYFYLGQVYQLDENFSESIKNYKIFEETARNKYVNEYKKITVKYKKECQHGEDLVSKKIRAWIDNVESVNSESDDYNPCISADGETMLFTSTRKNSNTPNDLGNYDSDIYTSILENATWKKPKNIGSPLNTPSDETASSIAYDGQRMLLFKYLDGNSDIYESKLTGIDWRTPVKKLSNNTNTPQNETFACYEPQDIKIYYIFDGSSRGDQEIFFTGLMAQYKKEDNIWGKGQSVGFKVNSQFHEGSVYIHPDGQTMYFSSQGHNSMGGYDIFMSVKDNLEQWQPPVNMGYPINTPYDDLFFAATANGKHAYISSNRQGGKGGLDIYKVTFWGPEKQILTDAEDYLLASIAQPVKDVMIESTVNVEQKKSLTVFKGNVIDAISRKPVGASIEITDNAKGTAIQTLQSNSATGKFLVALPSGINYGIAIREKGYLFHSENFNLPELSGYNMVNKVIELKNISVGSKIALRNIFFETGKADLKADSYTELGRLVDLMNDVPALKIEISGHTDNTGTEDINKKLSQERAQVVVNYLAGKGIKQNRLQAKGYGSSLQVATNENEDGRQLNRRTEFEIIEN